AARAGAREPGGGALEGSDWRRPLNAGAEQPVGERHRAGDPVRPAWIGAEAALPVERRGPALDGHRQVDEPARPEQAMAQCVKREDPEVILRARDPDVPLAEPDSLRAARELVEAQRVEVGGAVVKIDRLAAGRPGREGGTR